MSLKCIYVHIYVEELPQELCKDNDLNQKNHTNIPLAFF